MDDEDLFYDESDHDEADGPRGDDGASGESGSWFSNLTPGRRKGLIIGAVVAVIALIGGVAIALTGGDDSAEPVVTTTIATTTIPKITTTTEPDTGPAAPLTGLRMTDPGAATRPALAVKIDNLDTPRESAVPQAGLSKADVVFEEIVEGNITRLVAVFQSQSPGNRVGPVRSARTTDVHLLPQLGRTLLAWSGGNGGVVAAVRATPSIIDMGHDAATPAYSRDRSRRAPHNLFVDAGSLWSRAPGEVTPPKPLFEYRAKGEKVVAGNHPSIGVDLTWGGGAASSPVGWRWDPALRLYRRSQNGRPHEDEAGPIVSQNVVVLVTEYGQSPADLRSPEAHTVGSGEAFVFTAGKVVTGRWDRPAAEQPARLTTASGEVIKLTPGQTWIELPRAGGVKPL
ncbi:MAG: DUF3048 domain-containing protein [Acidimicrobiales bacterium]|nr:DUF3048 domain-containing protein [Acidimicrobiales bacterium]